MKKRQRNERSVCNLSHPDATSSDSTSSTSTSATPAKHVVAKIFPANQLHLIGGSVHSGKTTFVIDQFISRWQRKLPVFGHQSFPSPFCWVACSETVAAFQIKLQCTGLDPNHTFPVVSLVNAPNPHNLDPFDLALSLARDRTPDLEVIFLDGIHSVCPGNASDLNIVAKFLNYVSGRLEHEKVTAFGIGNSAKAKGDDRYSNPCERFLGSSIWPVSRTMIIFDCDLCKDTDTEDLTYTALVMPCHAPKQVIHYTKGSNGLYIPVYDELKRSEEFIGLLQSHPDETEFNWEMLMELVEVFGDQTPKRRTVEGWMSDYVTQGLLRVKWGKYTIAIPQ